MMSFALVKLLKASTQEESPATHTYHIEVRGMTGVKREEHIRIGLMYQLYSKDLRMEGEKRYAVRYLNHFTFTLVTEEQYNKLKTQWEAELKEIV
jgi:hypothetical protein